MSVSNRHSSAALRALSLALALACAAPLHAQVTHTSTPAHHKASLSTTIKSLLADPKVSAAHWGISVTALDGTPIYALNDAQRFQPYSNTKLFTTATALASIPTTRTWQTTLSAIGSMSSASTLRGVVTIASDGDAFLSTRPMPYNAEQEPQTPSLAPLDALAFALASKLRAAGISTVDGDVVAHDLLPTDPYALGTLASDMPWGYATPVSGLIYNDNAIGLAVTPGASVGAPALLALSPDFAFYTLQNDVATVIGSRADIDLPCPSSTSTTRSICMPQIVHLPSPEASACMPNPIRKPSR